MPKGKVAEPAKAPQVVAKKVVAKDKNVVKDNSLIKQHEKGKADENKPVEKKPEEAAPAKNPEEIEQKKEEAPVEEQKDEQPEKQKDVQASQQNRGREEAEPLAPPFNIKRDEQAGAEHRTESPAEAQPAATDSLRPPFPSTLAPPSQQQAQANAPPLPTPNFTPHQPFGPMSAAQFPPLTATALEQQSLFQQWTVFRQWQQQQLMQ